MCGIFFALRCGCGCGDVSFFSVCLWCGCSAFCESSFPFFDRCISLSLCVCAEAVQEILLSVSSPVDSLLHWVHLLQCGFSVQSVFCTATHTPSVLSMALSLSNFCVRLFLPSPFSLALMLRSVKYTRGLMLYIYTCVCVCVQGSNACMGRRCP